MELDTLQFDAISGAIDNLGAKLSDVTAEIGSLTGEMMDLNSTISDLENRRAFLTGTGGGGSDSIRPEDFEFDPDTVVRGFTPGQQAALI